MAIRHRRLPVEGVQFHPESFLTPLGDRLLRNFLELRPASRPAERQAAAATTGRSGMSAAAERSPMLERLLRGEDLSVDEAGALLVALAKGDVEAVPAGALLTALRAKGETSEEVRGFATAMRALAIDPEIPGAGDAVDVVGTGGDGSGSLNLSTGSALLAAAAGAPVVKHGNRSVSSLCGSADVLEALGYTLPADGRSARGDFERLGFTFLFAPAFHPAMKTLAAIRKALGVRTIFNLLGPLTNPARPGYAVLGAPNLDIARRMADAVARMPIRRAFVVHGAPGWDEATPVGPFHLYDVRDGQVAVEERDPAEVGVPRCSAEALRGGDAELNAGRLREALSGAPGADLDALALGAGLALEVCGLAPDLAEAVGRARTAAADGRGAGLLERIGSETTPSPVPSEEVPHV